MSERINIIQVAVGTGMEFYRYEGDEATARMIVRPYETTKTPVQERLDRQDMARLIAQRLKPVTCNFVPLPENLSLSS